MIVTRAKGAVGVVAMGLALAAAACGGGGSKSATSTARPANGASASATVVAGASTAVAGATNVPTAAAGATPAPAASAAATDESAAAQLCAKIEEKTSGKVASPDLIELSGLASSRSPFFIVWAHNDSGDTARVFAMNARGDELATYNLEGAEAIDWEDIAIGPSPSRDASDLYIGDIGDNAKARADIAVYRVPEPKVAFDQQPITATLAGAEKLTLRYPDGPHDAETLMVDPVSGDLIIVTKDAGGSEVFRAPGTIGPNAVTTLELTGRVDFGQLKKKTPFGPDAPPLAQAGGALATGGDISSTGDVIAIRTYSAIWLWARAPGQSIGQALAGVPCEAPSAAEPQGEAFAWDYDGNGYVTSSEGEHPVLHRYRAQGVVHVGS